MNYSLTPWVGFRNASMLEVPTPNKSTLKSNFERENKKKNDKTENSTGSNVCCEQPLLVDNDNLCVFLSSSHMCDPRWLEVKFDAIRGDVNGYFWVNKLKPKFPHKTTKTTHQCNEFWKSDIFFVSFKWAESFTASRYSGVGTRHLDVCRYRKSSKQLYVRVWSEMCAWTVCNAVCQRQWKTSIYANRASSTTAKIE